MANSFFGRILYPYQFSKKGLIYIKKKLSCTEDGLIVEEHHCSPGVKPEVLKERHDRTWLEPAMPMWKKGHAYILPKVKRPGTGKQRNSSISEMSGNRTHRGKSGHVELGHILLYLFILMIPFL